MLNNFLLVLALCHTVIPDMDKGTLEYHASSPDEEALVKATKELGVVFKARTPDAVIVEMVSVVLLTVHLIICTTHCASMVKK